MKILNKNQQKKGFTLLEMIVVVGIFALIVPLLGNLFINLYNLSVKSNMKKQVYQDVRYAMETIIRETRGATTLSASSDTNTITLAMEDGSTHIIKIDNGRIILTVKPSGSTTTKPPTYLTSTNSVITGFEVKTKPAGTGAFIQSFAQIKIVGQSAQSVNTGERPNYELKTIVSKN